ARAAFGRPLEALYQEWREDLRRRFFLLPAGVFAFLLWAVSAVLLVLAWRRRRRQNRERLARWELEEAEAMARRAERERELALLAQLQTVPPAPPRWMN
ncbi:MAG: hypothetical protein KA297_08845, partial [Kofleriaceae bacterium]|nr:hypothetical protein [Kofleriaceae bacterium]